ncbi:hypothetical protein [Legionella hackeliae]|uniref:Uncharacterized protein n=1 Tax=Legionella hackeliae TaxID=449 RepID=A0A0A8UV80_LEGHA|nr:hypothetical protein [Legionella hackeliae]KTD15204.1 hypothetical protein Lhac_0046 [Legionella hackeliae]CEK11431.1 protein of unknown function [Legionella hackeliae]STX48203.1 Uncharacterised protein [Legionella hackeliae]
MYKLTSQHRITIYNIPGRDITVVQGNSGIVYPFYKSTGHNSQSQETWFPWMGYFAPHPLGQTLVQFKNEIYMVKPGPCSVSEKVQEIIKKHLGNKANSFIHRFGNDEALAISCSFGGGEWEKNPGLKDEIINSSPLNKYVKKLKIEAVNQVQVQIPQKRKLIRFVGKNCSCTAYNIQAIVAEKMETITAEESKKYVSEFLVQDRQNFPSADDLFSIECSSHARRIRFNYLDKLGHKSPARENTHELNSITPPKDP